MIEAVIVILALGAATTFFACAYRNLKRQRYRQIDELDDTLGTCVAPWDEGSDCP